MVNLDQIKQLEERVSKAIELMQALKDENDVLKLELHDRQKRIEELENIVLVFKNDQAKIEEGIVNALNHLSAFEDTVYQAANSNAASTANAAPKTQNSAPDAVVTAKQEEAIPEETQDTQSPASATPDTAAHSDSQETTNQSNQLDIF